MSEVEPSLGPPREQAFRRGPQILVGKAPGGLRENERFFAGPREASESREPWKLRPPAAIEVPVRAGLRSEDEPEDL